MVIIEALVIYYPVNALYNTYTTTTDIPGTFIQDNMD